VFFFVSHPTQHEAEKIKLGIHQISRTAEDKIPLASKELCSRFKSDLGKTVTSDSKVGGSSDKFLNEAIGRRNLSRIKKRPPKMLDVDKELPLQPTKKVARRVERHHGREANSEELSHILYSLLHQLQVVFLYNLEQKKWSFFPSFSS
jgi:hypothetical protein